MNINNTQNINSKEQFIEFLRTLIRGFDKQPNEWENKTLPSFLQAAENWITDMDGYYINNKLPLPTNISWQVFADILIAATMYE